MAGNFRARSERTPAGYLRERQSGEVRSLNRQSSTVKIRFATRTLGMAKKTQAAKQRGAKTEQVRIGIIGGSGLYTMPGLEKSREVRVKTLLWKSIRCAGGRDAGRGSAWLPFAARARASPDSHGNQLPRERSRHEAIGRRKNHIRERGGVVARRIEAARFSDSRPVLRSYAPPDFHIFRGRRGGACGLWQSSLRAARGNTGRLRAIPQKCVCTAMALTFAWKVRNFPR